MCNFFDKYFQNRILNSIVNKNRVVSPIRNTIPAGDVEPYSADLGQYEKGLYKVRSQSDNQVWYRVDIDAGVCECIDGRSGKLCKHQKAVIVVNQIKCDRLFTGSAAEKAKFAALAVGKKLAGPETFWEDINDVKDTTEQAPANSESDSNHIDNDSAPITSNTINAGCSRQEVSEETSAEITAVNEGLLNEWISVIKEKLGGSLSSAETSKDISAAIRNTKRVAAPAQMKKLVRCFNSSMSYTASSRYIGVQPTAVARRGKDMPKGKQILHYGRPPKDAPTRRSKRKHDIAHNHRLNLPNATKH